MNSGLSINNPFLTINKAISSAAAGDSCLILPGTYREVLSITNRRGIPESPIYIYGYSRDASQRPLIDGGAVTPSMGVSNLWVNIQNSEWIEIGNLNFKNGWTDPVQISSSSYITLNECYFYGGRRVINAFGSNTHHLLIQNCYWDQGGDYLWTLVTGTDGIDAWTSMHHGAMQYYNGSLIHFGGTGGSIVIRNNTIANAFNGIRWSAQKSYDSNVEIYNNYIFNVRDNDIEPEYFTYNLHVYKNYSHNIHKTMSVDHVNGGYIYYYGNRITSNTDSWSNSVASSFWKIYGDGTNNLTYPMYAFNNSFCGVGKAFAMDSGTKAVRLKHFNNAYYFTGSRGWTLDYWDTTNEFDYDMSNKDWASNLKNNNQEIHGKYGNVKFADPVNFDLKLQPSSPAIDGGKIISLPELGWTQPFAGAAPDIGAYEGDELTDGPAFRFKTAPELNISYKEKPRIVKSKIVGNKLELYFSDTINPSTISVSAITLRENGSGIILSSVSMLDDNYRMEIECDRTLSENNLTLQFTAFPKGSNGEYVTMWASAFNNHKKDILLDVEEEKYKPVNSDKPSMSIYPNPFNNQAKLRIQIPSSYAVSEILTIRIFDLLGRLIQQQSFQANKSDTELSIKGDQFASGIYFVVLNFNKQTISQKFIVLK